METWPRVRGMSRRNPGLDAREKLPSVKAKAKMAEVWLHPCMVAKPLCQVKCNRPCQWAGRRCSDIPLPPSPGGNFACERTISPLPEVSSCRPPDHRSDGVDVEVHYVRKVVRGAQPGGERFPGQAGRSDHPFERRRFRMRRTLVDGYGMATQAMRLCEYQSA